MDAHKNARLTYLRRLEMAHEITDQSISVARAAHRAGVTTATARKWLGRYLAGGQAALIDASRGDALAAHHHPGDGLANMNRPASQRAGCSSCNCLRTTCRPGVLPC